MERKESACVVLWSGVGREGGMMEGAAGWTVETMDGTTKAVLGYCNIVTPSNYWPEPARVVLAS